MKIRHETFKGQNRKGPPGLSPALAMNLATKINSKLGGTDRVLDLGRVSLCSRPTLVFGIDMMRGM